jgi:hypothetical protein
VPADCVEVGSRAGGASSDGSTENTVSRSTNHVTPRRSLRAAIHRPGRRRTSAKCGALDSAFRALVRGIGAWLHSGAKQTMSGPRVRTRRSDR